MRRCFARAVSAGLFGLLLTPDHLHAQEVKVFQSSPMTNDDWGDPDRWQPMGMPLAEDVAVFDSQSFQNAGSLTVSTVDLGGVLREIQHVEFSDSSDATFNNGTLSVAGPIQNSAFDADIVFNVNLTARNGTLQSTGSPITVAGVIFDPEPAVPAGPQPALDVAIHGTLTGANTYTGVTFANESLTISGSGSIQQSARISVSNRHVFDVNDTGPLTQIDRIGDAARLDLRFGQATFTSHPDRASVERVGAIGLDVGESSLTINDAGFGLNLIAGQLDRVGRGTLEFIRGGDARLTLDALPPGGFIGNSSEPGTTDLAVVPFVVSSDNFITNGVTTYDRGDDDTVGTSDDVGLRALDPDTEQVGTLPQLAGERPNVRLETSLDATPGTVVNSLQLEAGGTVVILQGASFGIQSGAVVLKDLGLDSNNDLNESTAFFTNTEDSGTLDFGSAEGIFHTASDVRAKVDAPIAGSGGITKGGAGTLILNRPNTYSGGTAIAKGTLVSRSIDAFGTGTITLQGQEATLRFESVDQTYINPLRINSEGPINQSSSFIQFSNIEVESDITVGFTQPIHGFGTVNKIGSGTLSLNFSVIESSSDVLLFTANAGTLRLDGVAGGLVAATVQGENDSTPRLEGTPTLSAEANVNFGGTLAPGVTGTPGGVFSADRAIFGFGSTFEIEIGVGGSDQLATQNGVNLGGTGAEFEGAMLQVIADSGFTPADGTAYTIISRGDVEEFDTFFGGLVDGALFEAAGTTFQIDYGGGDGNDVVITAVPEPAFAGLCLLALPFVLRRRRRAAA